MTPRQARRERREAERKAKKLEVKKARQASGAWSPATENRQASARPLPGVNSQTRLAENHPLAAPDEFPDIQRWNPNAAGQPSCAWSASENVGDEFANPQRTALPGSYPANEFPREVQIRNNPMADRIALQAALPARAVDPEPNNGFVSQKRTETNRANSKFSTGPTSPKGKLASSRNSTKHGLASGQLIIPGEDPEEFESLLAALLEDHEPVDQTEELLVKEMAQSHWLAQRAIRLQNGCFTEEGVNEKSLSLFLRYFTTHNRVFHKALADLHRLRKERRKAQRGFVSQTAPKSAARSGFVSQNPASAAENGDFVRQNHPVTTLDAGFVSQTEPAEATERSEPAKQAA